MQSKRREVTTNVSCTKNTTLSLNAMEKRKKVGIIGGGAAGFFAAISAKQHHPEAEVVLYEKTSKVLAKVKISGGGRCNVTHHCLEVNDLIQAYPRGGRQLKSMFYHFGPKDTEEWFSSRGVDLKVENDGRMFPFSDDSQSIIDCLQKTCELLGVNQVLNAPAQSLHLNGEQWRVCFPNKEEVFDALIITTGGSPKEKGFDWLRKLGHRIITPVPSLFTFNMPKENITDLMGLVAQKTTVSIVGSKVKTQGPLLITHWGMSGPAILKASAFAARELAECQYQFNIRVQWMEENAHEIYTSLIDTVQQFPNKQIGKYKPFDLPQRLWLHLLEKTNIPPKRSWNVVGEKKLRRLVERLTNDSYQVEGKTTFKEEFVTCGGVNLKDVNLKTMESKIAKGIYFAGEVLDIDAITGGYNFQAAWSGGFLAGKLGGQV